VLSDIGSFGGCSSSITAAWQEPVLVSSADGVGTKLKVAFLAIAIAPSAPILVNHCVNDILVQVRRRCFSRLPRDRPSCRRMWPNRSLKVLPKPAKDNGCALLGGETAEMPGFMTRVNTMSPGFIVGAVDRSQIVDADDRSRSGDVLIGLPRTVCIPTDIRWRARSPLTS
jgi:phosphoribosylformylglycinamidine cyclo-ligase